MNNANITLSENAGKRIHEIVQNSKDNNGGVLRIAVVGGGCSGFQYTFDLTDNIQEQDLILENNGGKVVIDPISIQYMEGSEIDFVDDLIGQSFKINNPNTTASCGCGTSFSI